MFFFFFKQKTAYEISVRDWSSDVCSSDLAGVALIARYNTALPSDPGLPQFIIQMQRSEERRVGKECERLFRSRWSPGRSKKNTTVLDTDRLRLANNALRRLKKFS